MIAVAGLMAIVACVAYPGVRPLRHERHADVGRERSRWCSCIWVTMFGAAVGVRDAGHIGMESLLVLVPERMRLKLELVIHVLVRHLRRADGVQRRAARACR